MQHKLIHQPPLTPPTAEAAAHIDARAQFAMQLCLKTVKILEDCGVQPRSSLPFPFNAPLVGYPTAQLPSHATEAISEFKAALQPERTAVRSGMLRGASFLRYLEALQAAAPKKGDAGNYSDLVLDTLLEVKDPGETESGIPLTHHFTPTSAQLIPKLIQFGEISSSDRVIDLGCGNGRLLALLRLSTHCEGHGVELLQHLVKQGTSLLQRNKIAGVTLEFGNALRADLSDATVIVMYAPFYAKMFRSMVALLEERAQKAPLRVLLHGPMETFLEESVHFRVHPNSATLRRFDAIPDSATLPDGGFEGVSLPAGRHDTRGDTHQGSRRTRKT